jgi:hypothetical protein
MKKILFLMLLFVILINLNATKYAGEIFHLGAGVRNFALGNCGLTDTNSFAASYWNSALLTHISENRFELMHAEEFTGLLKYDTASAVWGKDTKFSAVFSYIGINDIPLTALQNPDAELSNDNRPYEYKNINNSDFVGYFGFSRKIAGYNIGFTPKVAYRTLAEETGFGFGADISVFFALKENWFLALKIRDFFSTQILWSTGTHEIVNPSLDAETKLVFHLPFWRYESKLYFRSEIFTEGRSESSVLSAGFISLDPHFGLEGKISKNIDLLLGYDVDNFTSGLSIHLKSWLLNYSLEMDSALENSHRISVGFTL